MFVKPTGSAVIASSTTILESRYPLLLYAGLLSFFTSEYSRRSILSLNSQSLNGNECGIMNDMFQVSTFKAFMGEFEEGGLQTFYDIMQNVYKFALSS